MVTDESQSTQHTDNTGALALHEPKTLPLANATPDRMEAVEAMRSVKFRIPGDVIAQATANLPDAQRITIRWFSSWCRQRNLSPDDIGALLTKPNGKDTYSWASIYAVLTGRRQEAGANIVPVVEAMEVLRRKVETESRAGDSGFIRTRMSEAIYARCDRARKMRKIGFIFGPSQIGKSEALINYTAEHNHGETIYLEVPTGGSLSKGQAALGDTLSIPQMHRAGDLQNRIISCFSKSMLLIVDEAHRCLHTERGLLFLDFLRELYNKAGCGIVLAMTDEGRGHFDKGPFATRLKQLWNRRLAPLQLPKTVPEYDLALFATSYDLDPAGKSPVTVRTKYTDEEGKTREKDFTAIPAELQAKVVSAEGLGVWLTILQDAKEMAKEQRRSISWAAVLKAYCISQADAEVWG